jgi:hypothetical protein
MAGALRRTDWSSTPHPTPRGAPPESVCCFGLCHGDASIVGDGEYLPELRRYDVIRYGWQNSMVLEVVRRSAPYTRYLSPLWRRRSRMHFAFTLLIPSGKGWVVVYMCGPDEDRGCMSRGREASVMASCRAYIGAAAGRSKRTRTTSSSGRLFTRSAAMMRVTSMGRSANNMLLFTHTHHNQRF